MINQAILSNKTTFIFIHMINRGSFVIGTLSSDNYLSPLSSLSNQSRSGPSLRTHHTHYTPASSFRYTTDMLLLLNVSRFA